jgi:Reverse transcriptase (RNA-dependent DNA polymerase)
VFQPSAFDELPQRRKWDYAIDLDPKANISNWKTKIYSLAPEEQKALDVFLEEHLKSGRIRPSKSPIAAPFFFIKKKDGTLRSVQDYRRVNEITVKNRYPLPLISEVIDRIKDDEYFTKLDIRCGYNEVRIKEGDEWKAAFITNRGLYKPTVMFFGLSNSPSTLQTMMDEIFQDEVRQGWFQVYMDDILITGQTKEENFERTRHVLQKCREHKLYFKLEKCMFATRSACSPPPKSTTWVS